MSMWMSPANNEHSRSELGARVWSGFRHDWLVRGWATLGCLSVGLFSASLVVAQTPSEGERAPAADETLVEPPEQLDEQADGQPGESDPSAAAFHQSPRGGASVAPGWLSGLGTILADASKDLGLVLETPPRVLFVGGERGVKLRWEDDLRTPSRGLVNLGAALEESTEKEDREKWLLRVIVVEHDGTAHGVRVELEESDYEVQTIRALTTLSRVIARPEQPEQPEQGTPQVTSPDASQGRATLATAGAVLGGYFGFALENAGGDVDTRLVYPLVALGAGVGLASALIVAEEWPMDRPSAWFIAGGGLWLTVSGVLIAGEQELKHETDRYPYGLIGTVAGLGLSSYIVSQRQISEAEAVFSQSGALFGSIAGGFVHQLIEPSSDTFPSLGVGLGTGGGWLLTSLGTAQWMPGLSSSRVLFADLGGFLGALVGAAAASPTIVSQGTPPAADQRAFVGASLAGLVVGASVGYWLGGTSDSDGASFPSLSMGLGSIAGSLPETPFEVTLPAASAVTLRGQW